MLKHLPVVIQLYESEISEADLIKELKVDKHRIDRELLRQPGLYAWWAALYSASAEKCEKLQMRMERLQAQLSTEATRKLKTRSKYVRAGEVQDLVKNNKELKRMQERLLRWRSAERQLKYAVRAFEQRKDVIQSYCANQRREQDAEPKVRNRSKEDD
jgi:predicted  nucleic acid-binding Zn-ribbon protein